MALEQKLLARLDFLSSLQFSLDYSSVLIALENAYDLYLFQFPEIQFDNALQCLKHTSFNTCSTSSPITARLYLAGHTKMIDQDGHIMTFF